MTAITSDMRIVCTSEAAPKPRRMSGLGIDFSPVRTPPGAERSRNYFWQEQEASYSNAPLIGTTSRWSASTEQSATPPWAEPSRQRASFASSSGKSRHSRSQSVQIDQSYTKKLVSAHARRQSEIDADTFVRMHQHLRHARCSDDSQDSGGPLTPQEELEDTLVKVADILNFGECPRKAPMPPVDAKASRINAIAEDPVHRTLRRRPSAPQSMLRTLSNRIKETKAPPPLTFAHSAPVPARGAQVEVAPVVHRLDLPLHHRSSDGTPACTNSPTLQSASNSHQGSPRPESRGSGKGSTKGSIGSLFRTVRRSISSVGRKNSASGTGGGLSVEDRKIGLQRVVLSPIKQKVAVADFDLKATSLPTPPGLDHAKQGDSPKMQVQEKACPKVTLDASQPSTAIPGAHYMLEPFTSGSSHLMQSRTSTISGSSSARSGWQATEQNKTFGIEYRDPWTTSTTFRPASDYAVSERVSPSLTAWLPPKVSSSGKLHTSRTEATIYKQSVIDADKIKHFLDSNLLINGEGTYKTARGYFKPARSTTPSPTVASSWRNTSGISSPDNALPVPSSTSFLQVEDSPLQAQTSNELLSVMDGKSPKSGNRKKRISSASIKVKRMSEPVFNTPGNVQMRNPWLAGSANQDLAQTSRADSTHPAAGDRALRKSPILPSQSPAQNEDNHYRRPSRNAVPMLYEAEEDDLDSRPLGESQQVWGGVSYELLNGEKVSGIPVPKQIFAARPSLPDVYAACPQDQGQYRHMSTSRSRSFAAPSTIVSDGIDFSMVVPQRHRPSYATADTFSTMRRSSFASEGSLQTFPSRPTRLEVKRLPLNHPNGIRISFDGGVEL